MMDDRALVTQVLSGDMQAFKILIRQNERLVAHMIGRLVDQEEDREELCQDTFLKIHDKLSEFGFQSKLSTWIATIAYRNAINYLRKRRIEVTGIPDEEHFQNHFVAEDNPAEQVEDDDMNAHILKLIEWLPVHYKTVLTLYHLEGMTYPEIGEVTGMPAGTVKNYLFRARNLLKEKVKSYLGKEEVL